MRFSSLPVNAPAFCSIRFNLSFLLKCVRKKKNSNQKTIMLFFLSKCTCRFYTIDRIELAILFLAECCRHWFFFPCSIQRISSIVHNNNSKALSTLNCSLARFDNSSSGNSNNNKKTTTEEFEWIEFQWIYTLVQSFVCLIRLKDASQNIHAHTCIYSTTSERIYWNMNWLCRFFFLAVHSIYSSLIPFQLAAPIAKYYHVDLYAVHAHRRP